MITAWLIVWGILAVAGVVAAVSYILEQEPAYMDSDDWKFVAVGSSAFIWAGLWPALLPLGAIAFVGYAFWKGFVGK